MTQLRSFAMTDTAGTFRQDAGAYRNLRDWTKEQRDKAIQQANERANPVEAEAPIPAGDASGASPASSFVTAVSDTEAYTMSQESRTSLNEGTVRIRMVQYKTLRNCKCKGHGRGLGDVIDEDIIRIEIR
jgi:hypothetical protein